MYGSYGSYSSMSARSAPIDIISSSRGRDHSCAFPSWPRRASLSESDAQEPPRATSYLSDDDLLFSCDDAVMSSSEDETNSIASTSSSTSSSPANFLNFPAAPVVEVALSDFDLQRQRLEKLEAQNQALRERERRKMVYKQQRRMAAMAAKKYKNLASMAPIAE
ncbi:hypothetical protein VHEMI00106 [[Torrubiella] hemipterigena]|uniref:Uncharacterized protein n=1 Tax=[Torrubiella] hemipterigena TaxID=1531966 RepID=A0A0A1SIC2_9HYPO|nr:hypothetical protein VHEMI00106 [[Torrubiella] hemipterigena]